MMKRPVWIDTDTGIDDTMALMVGTQLDEIDIVGVSAVAGNVELEHTFRNARNVLALIGRSDIPVYPGADRPWILPLSTAPDAHGENGLGNVVIPDSGAPVETKHAWDALYEAACRYPGELRVVTIGPMTNLATAFAKYPKLPSMLKEVAIMGGAIIGGNRTPSAEFNILADPHAAQCVFKSGVEIAMFGLDVTHQMSMTEAEINEIAAKGTPAGKLLKEANAYIIPLFVRNGYGRQIFMHDTCPVIYLQHPELFEGKRAGVNVETRSAGTMGKTVSDLYVYADALPLKNVTVMLKGDREGMVRIVKELLERI